MSFCSPSRRIQKDDTDSEGATLEGKKGLYMFYFRRIRIDVYGAEQN